MTKIKNLKVQTNVHEKADVAAAKLKPLFTQVASTNPYMYSTHRGNLPAILRKTPHAIDKAVVIDNGMRAAIQNHFKNKSLSIKTKASSLTSEFEQFYKEFVLITGKQQNLIEGVTVNRVLNNGLKVIDRNLVAQQPWHASNRFDVVDLLDYRAALINDNPIKIQSYNNEIFDRALASVIPTKYLGKNEIRNLASLGPVNNIIVCAPHLSEYTAPSLLASVEKLFGVKAVRDQYNAWTENRWIDGTIKLTEENGMKDVVFQGGNDHDGGVATMLTYDVLIARDPDAYAQNPNRTDLVLITFFSLPVVSTQIGYEALLTSQVVEEKGWDFVRTWPHTRSRLRAADNFNVLTEPFMVKEGVKDGDPNPGSQPVFVDRNVVAFADLSLVVNRLQAEVTAFYKKGGSFNLDLIFNTNYDKLPAIFRKVFGVGNYLVDAANLYRAYNFFAENELPGFIQNLANKSAEHIKNGGSCCSQCDEMKDKAEISCNEYKIRAAIRSALDFKINQMFDGYRTGNTLLRAFFSYHHSSFDMTYMSDIRAELIRIACRNIHDLYSKGYYSRLGATSNAFRQWYFRNLMGEGYTAPIKVLINYNPTPVMTEPIDGPGVNEGNSNAIDFDNPEYTINPEHKIDIAYGYEKMMRSFTSEFVGTIGPITKELGSTVIAY